MNNSENVKIRTPSIRMLTIYIKTLTSGSMSRLCIIFSKNLNDGI